MNDNENNNQNRYEDKVVIEKNGCAGNDKKLPSFYSVIDYDSQLKTGKKRNSSQNTQ